MRSSMAHSHQRGPRSPSPCLARPTRTRAAVVASASPERRLTPTADRARPRCDVSRTTRFSGSSGSVRRQRRPLMTIQCSSSRTSEFTSDHPAASRSSRSLRSIPKVQLSVALEHTTVFALRRAASRRAAPSRARAATSPRQRPVCEACRESRAPRRARSLRCRPRPPPVRR